MVKRQARLIFADEHKGRATSILGSPKPPEDSLCEACLSRAKIAGQKENIACIGIFAKQPTDVLGPFGAGGREGDGLLFFGVHRISVRPA